MMIMMILAAAPSSRLFRGSLQSVTALQLCGFYHDPMALGFFVAFWSLLLATAHQEDPVPPCPAPFPGAAVGETWCSTPLASNPATGVSVAQYGLPAGSTLVTAATSPALWYDVNFYLGGGVSMVFEYFAKAGILAKGRTVPLIMRPLSPLATPAGWWLTSMLVSPANYPDAASTLPSPNATNVYLEPLGAHFFATLDFNSTSCPPLYPPPYFTAFQRCDALLAAGLPSGWVLKADSVWSPAWLLYNSADYNGTWTSRCLAEVVRGGGAAPAPPAAPTQLPAPPAPPAAALPAGALRTPGAAAAAPAAAGAAAPPICALVLEFETVAYGAWALPHAPNTAIDINGGSDGLRAKDDAAGLIVFATSTDTPFFTLRLAAITLATGAVATVGNPFIAPPPGFPGTGADFLAVAHSPALGFVVLAYELSKFGPMPTRSSTPGTPLGWTAAAAVDPRTGASSALTADLTPALLAFPPLVRGPSALDAARSVLWLLSAGDGANPLGPQGCGDSAARAAPRARCARRPCSGSGSGGSSNATAAAGAPPALAPSTQAYFLGVPLAPALHQPAPPAASAALTAIPIAGEGMVVTAYEYASAVDAIVALSYNVTGGRPPPYFSYSAALITAYPVNGSAPFVLGGIPAGTYSPYLTLFASQVSADGRFVYFSAVQPASTFESAALITVDALTGAVATVNAAPTDDYDVFNLFRC